MKMGFSYRDMMIVGVVSLIAINFNPSSALNHLVPIEESKRLAGSDSDVGNLMVLNQLDSEVVLPSDGFSYFLKRLSEDFAIVIEFNQEKKVKLLLDRSEERKREVRISEERGLFIPDNIVREQRESVEEADRIIQILSTKPSPNPTLRAQLIDRIQIAFDQSEVSEIRKDFQDLRNERDTLVKQELADRLDTRLNDRTDVRIACFGGIDTLSIANSPEPIRTLRDNCPVLNIFPEEEIRRMMEFGYGS